MADEKALWYVVHTYSGYENKVANDLVKTVENNGMGDLIQEVTVPIEEVVEIRNGKPHTIQHKLFPGYVLVKTGSVENAIGTVEEINAEEHKVKVSIEILNRKTTVEYDISEVERL